MIDVTGFGSFDNSTYKRVLDLLEPGDLILGQVVINRVAAIKRGVNNGSDDGRGCFGIEAWTELTNMIIAGSGDRWDLVRKGEVFIKYEADVSSRVSGVKWGVVDFGKLLTETNELWLVVKLFIVFCMATLCCVIIDWLIESSSVSLSISSASAMVHNSRRMIVNSLKLRRSQSTQRRYPSPQRALVQYEIFWRLAVSVHIAQYHDINLQFLQPRSLNTTGIVVPVYSMAIHDKID